MPQVGERRSGATETVEWDGSRWAPVSASPSTVDNPRSFGLLNYIPGLKDALNIPENLYKGASALPDVASGLLHNPGATLKGFASGASEAATPGRVGLLSLLTGGATLPAALTAAGGQSVADATRVATGAPNAPTSLGGGVKDVAEAASVPAVAAAATAVPGLVSKIPGAVGSAVQKVGPSTAYGTLGAIDGYRRGGITGAIEEGLIGAAGGRLSGRLSKALDAIAPEAGAGASATAAPAEAPVAAAESAPSAISSIERARLRRQGYTPEMIDGFEQQLSAKPSTPIRSSPKATPVASKLDSALGGLTGDTASAAADNIANGSSFSNGHILPEGRPTELTDLAEEGGARRDQPFDIDYGGVVPDFSFEAGDANRPGLSVGSAGPKTTLDRLEQATTAIAPPTRVPVTRVVDRGLPFESDKPNTWMVQGHLGDDAAAQLNDMYKSGNGDVLRGHITGPATFDASDELGNTIGYGPTGSLGFKPSDGMARTFSQFSDDVDNIANQEPGPLEDLFGRKSGFLSRSTPTKADQAGLAEIRARRLASTLQALQPQ